jgi:glycosyltransferase involved in cell wall biosynthesis
MSKPPLISICVPTYNQVEFLSRTFRSISGQTFRDFEVVVSDDSTNDLVSKLVEEYRNELPIVYKRNTTSLGSPANWNAALDLAQGSYIKFMHHDDWFADKEALQKFYNAICKPGIDFVFSASKVVNQGTGREHVSRAGFFFLRNLRQDVRSLFANNKIGAPSATMYKSNQLRFDPSIKFVVDIDFYIRALEGKRFVYIPEALIVNTSGHEGQVTAASQDRATQLGEHSYLYKKHCDGKIPGPATSIFFIRLFRSYRVQDLEEVTVIRNALLRPEWYFKFLISVSRIKTKKKR